MNAETTSQGGWGRPAPGRPPGRPATRLGGGGTAALVWWQPVALAGLDPVAAAVRRPPRPAPGHRLGAVGWAGPAGVGDHAEAAAGQRREGFGVVRRSWHGSRLQDSSGSSTACWRVLSLQLTSDRSSSQCAPVRPSSAWWNDIENDIPPLHPTPCRSNVALGRAGASGPPRPLAPPNRAPAASSTERGRHRRNAESLRPDTSRLTCLCVQGERQLERIGEHLGSLSWLRLALIRPRLHEQRLLRVGSSVDFEPAAAW